MPQIAELREIDGQLWAKIPIDSNHGIVTLWTQEEIQHYRESVIREALLDLFSIWKDRNK